MCDFCKVELRKEPICEWSRGGREPALEHVYSGEIDVFPHSSQRR